MKRSKHQPIRTCMGCGKRDRRSELLRVVYDQSAGLIADPCGRRPGRGGYLHFSPQCAVKFAARQGLLRSLGVSVERPVRAAFISSLAGNGTDRGAF